MYCLGKNYRLFAVDYIEKEHTSAQFPNHLVAAEETRIFDGIFRGRGDVNPYEVKQEVAETLNAKAYVYRNHNDLAEGLKKVRELKQKTWKHVDDSAKEYNTNFQNVMELDSMFRVAEIVLLGALEQKRISWRLMLELISQPVMTQISFTTHLHIMIQANQL